jgi:hypothetical protein
MAREGEREGERKLRHFGCVEESKASLKCIEDNYPDRGPCKAFFDTYKECKKKALQAIREERIRNQTSAF